MLTADQTPNKQLFDKSAKNYNLSCKIVIDIYK